MAILEEELERTSKYLKRWVKRFVSFNDGSRKLSYGTSKYRIKRTMILTKVTRVAEPAEPYAVSVEGVAEDGEPQTWSIRMPDVNSFNLWFITLRNSLSEKGTFSSVCFSSPSSAPSSEYKTRLIRFYQKHAPIKLAQVDRALEVFKGREEELFATLVEKYGREPSIPQNMDHIEDSPAIIAQRYSISSFPEDKSPTVSPSPDQLSNANPDQMDVIDFDEI